MTCFAFAPPQAGNSEAASDSSLTCGGTQIYTLTFVNNNEACCFSYFQFVVIVVV